MFAKRTLQWLLLVGCIIAMVGVVGLSQTEAAAKGLNIVVEGVRPPEGAGFAVDLKVNKGCGASYALGESLTLSVTSAQAGYLTIYDFMPDGTVTLIFPNYYHPNNFVEANTPYQIPGPQDAYKFEVGPPQGMDILKAIVTTAPGIAPSGKADASSPFPVLSKDQMGFAKGLNIIVKPGQSWGTATCIYYIGPQFGSVTINSVPQGAAIYWDGAYYSLTPMTIPDQARVHSLVLKKEGYRDWIQQVAIVGNESRSITATLEPLGAGWQARPKAPSNVGGITELWANAFNSDGSAQIDGWYWLTDSTFQASFGWRFPIDGHLLSSTEAWFNLAPLVTNAANGGPGYETIVQMIVVIRDVYGTVVSQTIRQVRLTNSFRPKSPANSNGKGYQTCGLLPLELPLAGLPLGGTVEVTASRIPTSYDGVYQPHVAFNPDALVLRCR